MRDTAHPHVDPHHADAAHPHVHTVPPDKAMRKTLLFGVVGGIVVIGVAATLMSSSLRKVDVKNTGSTDVRVEYAWTANGQRVTRDKQVAPGNSISFGFEPQSEITVYHPAPDDAAAWAVIPVGEKDGKFEISPTAREELTATKDGQSISLTLKPVPVAKR
jgi:hypothetical protein